ncbi:hypothetical protein H9X57_06960 [Flavobacterium piscinae]|nr:hypothetical protein [Flavobacterium piscinae]
MRLKLFLLILFLSQVSFSQDLIIKEKLINVSENIDDAKIEIEVLNGSAPFSYKWNKQDVSLSSNFADKLTEGIPYSVIITDNLGKKIEKLF